MTHRLNWKWGETCPICAPANSNAEIQIGDLLWLDSDGLAQPASTFALQTDLAGTQKAFALKFLGIAMQSSPAGRSGTIRVATTGTFEFADDSANPSAEILGTYLGPNLNSDGAYLKRNSLCTTASSQTAVARVIHQEGVPAGKVFAAVLSTIAKGGVCGSDPLHAVTQTE